MSVSAIPIPERRLRSLDFEQDEFYIALSTPDTTTSHCDLIRPPSLASVLNCKRKSCVRLSSPCSHSGSFMSASSSLDNTTVFDDDVSVSSVSSYYNNSYSSNNDTMELWLNVEDHPLSEKIQWANTEFEQKPLKTVVEEVPKKQNRLVSKLSRSLKSISNFAQSFSSSAERNQRILATYQTASASSRIPLTIQQNQEPEPIPLQTFSVSEKRIMPRISTQPTTFTRSREPRINSSFLRVYALDYSSKLNGLLNVTEDEIDLYQQCLEQKDYLRSMPDSDDDSSLSSCSSSEDEAEYMPLHIFHKRESLRIALMSREKLWSNVVLAPREDQIEDSSLYKSKYTCINDKTTNSRTRLNSSILPWINYSQSKTLSNSKCIKPYGVLGNNTQFVVKGWVDQRWISSSASPNISR